MAFTSPLIIPMSKVGYQQSIDGAALAAATRTVMNLSVPSPVIDVFSGGEHYPMGGQLQPLGGGQLQPISFSTYFNPSGESGAVAKTPPDGALFMACGMKQAVTGTASATYTYTGDLVTDTTAATMSAAVGNGLKFTATTAVGNLTLRGVAGQPVVLDWSFLGLYSKTDAGITDALNNGGGAPVCVGNTTTLGGDTLVMRSWTIALNNAIDSRADLAAATGYQTPKITRQTPTLEVLVECPVIATEDYFADMLTQGGKSLAFSTVLGTGAGYVITITGTFYLGGVQGVALGNLYGLRLSCQQDPTAPLTIALT